MSTLIHPRRDDAGKPVPIPRPHVPTSPESWSDPTAAACFVPDGAVPPMLNSLPVTPWVDAPARAEGWEALAAAMDLPEPAFACPAGLKPAAGAVVLEPDGRAWCIAPTDGFGGYEYTFAKGRTDGRSLKATALVEVFEEAGLRIHLHAFLCDVSRNTTYTRFYLAARIGGSPACMGWESQSVVLAPPADLRKRLTHPADGKVLDALARRLAESPPPAS